MIVFPMIRLALIRLVGLKAVDGADRTQPADPDSAGRVHRWARIPTDERG